LTRVEQIQQYKKELIALNQKLRIGKINKIQYEHEAEQLDRRYNPVNYE